MLWEDRQGERKLVFPGGSRIDEYENPLYTAARETIEETGYLFSEESRIKLHNEFNKTVVWIPQSKYALYISELDNDIDLNIDIKYNSINRNKINYDGNNFKITGMVWVQERDLLKNLDINFHFFTQKIINILKYHCILPFKSNSFKLTNKIKIYEY